MVTSPGTAAPKPALPKGWSVRAASWPAPTRYWAG